MYGNLSVRLIFLRVPNLLNPLRASFDHLGASPNY